MGNLISFILFVGLLVVLAFSIIKLISKVKNEKPEVFNMQDIIDDREKMKNIEEGDTYE